MASLFFCLLHSLEFRLFKFETPPPTQKKGFGNTVAYSYSKSNINRISFILIL